MKVPSILIEKVLSALQIAKLTGEIKTGIFEVTRSMENNKAKYIILALDAKPKNNKIRKKISVIKLLAEENKIPLFEFSSKKELGKLIGLEETGASCISIINPDRAGSLFKDVSQKMKEEVQI